MPMLTLREDERYHGLTYIEGAPFKIAFWTVATNITTEDALARIAFADELVRRWNEGEKT